MRGTTSKQLRQVNSLLSKLQRLDQIDQRLNTLEKAVESPPWWETRRGGGTLKVLEILVGILTVVATFGAIWSIWIAYSALKDQRISAAWQILAVPSLSATGKQYALATLVELNDLLQGVDVSCEAMNPKYEPDQTAPPLLTCGRGPDLRSMKLIKQGPTPTRLEEGNFRNADASSSTIENVQFVRTNFSGTNFAGSTFSKTSFERVIFENAGLHNATMQSVELGMVNLSGAVLSGAQFSKISIATPALPNEFAEHPFIEISDTNLCSGALPVPDCATGLTDEFFQHAWYDADHPPSFGGDGTTPFEDVFVTECPAHPRGRSPEVSIPIDCDPSNKKRLGDVALRTGK